MISAVHLIDTNGYPHEIWLEGMEFRVDSTGEYDMRATIKGKIVAAPAHVEVGPRQIVSESGEVLGTYGEREKWRTKP